MSDSTGDRAYARDARRQPVVVWVSLLVFFIGLGLMTAAVVALADDKVASAVLAVVGVPVAAVGLAVTLIKGDLSGVE